MPAFLRLPVYKLYANTFGVNVSEALNEDLMSYLSLADFFARPLKEGIRLIDRNSCLVSPCDGTVLHFGTVHTEQVEQVRMEMFFGQIILFSSLINHFDCFSFFQVKGVTYSLKDFLGENSWRNNNNNSSNTDFRTSLLHQPHVGNTLYQCVIYLAPGDYHR